MAKMQGKETLGEASVTSTTTMVNINGKRVKLMVSDTAGQERFRTITSSYYKGSDSVVVTFSVNYAESFEFAKGVLQEIIRHGNSVLCILIGNVDCDPDEPEVERVVQAEDIMEVCKGSGVQYYEISARDKPKVQEIFDGLASVMIQEKVQDGASTSSEAKTLKITQGRNQGRNQGAKVKKDDTPTAMSSKKDIPPSKDPMDGAAKKACVSSLKAKTMITIMVVIFNYLGLPRSGKTSLRRRIMGEILNIMAARKNGETNQPSTGIVEDGGQLLIKPSFTEMGTIRSKVWSAIKNLGDEANMLNQFFHQISTTTQDPPTTKSSTAKASNPVPVRTSKNPIKHLLNRKKSEEGSKEGKGKHAVLADDKKEDEMFSIIAEALESDNWEDVKYLLDETILLVNNDTGGHSEFLDLQGSLIQGPSFNLLFSRLVDDLDSMFSIYFTDEEGNSSEKEDSTMTVEEVMFQALSSIACFSGAYTNDENKASQSKAMFIGTHLDMVTEEEFKAKDEYLRKKIERTDFYKKDIIEYASEDQLMIVVDNWNGGQAEIKGIQEILERVIEKSFAKIPIPAAWLVMSLYLRKKKFRTISLSDCEEIALKLNITPSELQEALRFLHHQVGVILYYPEVKALKDTVICQMQVVFDSVSNLIRNTFTFDKVGQRVSKEFREKGQFSLKDVKKATSGFTDSLIPLEKLVMLLQHLNVLTPISTSSEPTYFMPCVLQTARAGQLEVSVSSSQEPAPLMLHYECGYVPTGVFPSMITNLVSQQRPDWKLIQKGLYKNRVQFRVGEEFDTVTLVSRPRYFEITLSRNQGFETPIAASLCAYVRGVVQSTLSIVTSHMNSKFSMGYKFGFECPIHPEREHICVLAHEKAKLMECLEDPADVETAQLEPRHKLWFVSEGEPVPTLPLTSSATPEEFSSSLKTLNFIKWRDQHGQLCKFQLVSHVSVKWRDFGMHFGMTLNDLDAFDREHRGNARDIWNKVMDYWLAGQNECDYPVSWDGLYTLLRDLDFSEVANQLEEAVCGNMSS